MEKEEMCNQSCFPHKHRFFAINPKTGSCTAKKVSNSLRIAVLQCPAEALASTRPGVTTWHLSRSRLKRQAQPYDVREGPRISPGASLKSLLALSLSLASAASTGLGHWKTLTCYHVRVCARACVCTCVCVLTKRTQTPKASMSVCVCVHNIVIIHI